MIPILLFIQGNIKNISQFEGFAGSFRRGKWGIFLMGKDKSPIFGEYSPNMGDLSLPIRKIPHFPLLNEPAKPSN